MIDWISVELPSDLPAACLVTAANYYAVPPELIVAMLKIERGEVGKEYVRKHGTYYGPTQVSDKWLPVFKPWGLDAAKLTHDACANLAGGTYVMAYYRAREPDWSRAIARYNVGSLNTPEQIEAGKRYATKVLAEWDRLYKKWGTGYATK